jgi:poly-gamma-glutamate capsule biosynthesis protein CapA/YwtB (metallophosphatase superfamily)
VSNFPLSYRLSWLPRLLKPSLAGRDAAFGPIAARFLHPAHVIRLAFLGDISRVAGREPPQVDAGLAETIAAADLVVGNCESPVMERPAYPVATRLGLRHAMTPAFLDAAIAACGAKPQQLLLSLANNHALDQGEKGFAETEAALRERGIGTVGTVGGGTLRRVDVGGIAIDFLAFTQWRNASPASFAGRIAMTQDIAGWTRREGADLTCVLPHWDVEFRHFPHAATRRLARHLAQADAGLIVGAHAHVLQPVERVGAAVVAYGLADFLGTVSPCAPWPLRLGAILSVEVSADAGTKGQVAAYRVVPFIRHRCRQRERLVPVGPGDTRVVERLGVLFQG